MDKLWTPQASKKRPPVPRVRKTDVMLTPLVATMRRERVARGFTMQVLADKAGYHRRMIENWETGKAQPTLRGFEEVCTALGLRLVLEDLTSSPA